MKKGSLFCLLTVSTILFCSCENTSLKISLPLNLDITNKKTVNINTDSLITFIDSKQDFVLYIYSPSCYLCEKVESYLDSFVSEYSCLIYSYDVKANRDYFSLSSKYPDFFPTEFSTPCLDIFKEGELMTTFSENKYLSETMFISTLKNFISLSNIRYTSTFSGFENYMSNQYGFVILLDKKNLLSYDFYSKSVKMKLFSSTISTLILEKPKDEEFENIVSLIKTKFDIEISSELFMFYYYENTLIKSEYLLDSSEKNETVLDQL